MRRSVSGNRRASPRVWGRRGQWWIQGRLEGLEAPRPWRRSTHMKPDINDSEEKWIEYLKLDKNNELAMLALKTWLAANRRIIAASHK
jgi:hypothetical protein